MGLVGTEVNFTVEIVLLHYKFYKTYHCSFLLLELFVLAQKCLFPDFDVFVLAQYRKILHLYFYKLLHEKNNCQR